MQNLSIQLIQHCSALRLVVAQLVRADVALWVAAHCVGYARKRQTAGIRKSHAAQICNDAQQFAMPPPINGWRQQPARLPLAVHHRRKLMQPWHLVPTPDKPLPHAAAENAGFAATAIARLATAVRGLVEMRL